MSFSFGYAKKEPNFIKNIEIMELEKNCYKLSIEQEGIKQKIEKIEKNLNKKEEERYEDVKNYYKETVKVVTNHFTFIEGFTVLILSVIGFSWWRGSGKLEKNLKRLKKDIEEQKKEKEELNEKILKQEQITKNLENIVNNQKKELEESQYNTKIGFAINKNTSEEKIKELEKMIKYYESNKQKLEQIYFFMAYYNASNAEKINYYNKVIELNPKFPEAYNNRGIIKREVKDYGGALEDYNKALELKPTYVEAYNNRGIIKGELKDYEGAIKDYNVTLELNPDYVNSYINRGIVKRELKDYKGALKDYNKALELNSQLVETYFNRGIIKGELKDYKGALEDYNKAIELKELKDYNKVKELSLHLADIYCNRAIIKRDLEDFKGALEDYKKAKELKPELPELPIVKNSN